MRLSSCLLACALFAAIALMADPAYAQPTKTVNRIGYSGASGGVEYFVGVDYRLEILELFENWLGEEDPAESKPIQMHPLRREMLEELAPFKDHKAVTALKKIIEKYNYYPEKLILNAGDLPRLDSQRDWLAYSNTLSWLKDHDPQEFNQDMSAWFDDVNSFVEDSNIMGFFKKHEAEYRAVADEFYSATINGQMLDTVLSKLKFPEASLSWLACPMIKQDRNYATYFKDEDSSRITGYYYCGPYRQVEQGLFRYASYNDVPVTYDDPKEFIRESIHELTHMLLGDAIRKAVGESSEEYIELLAPLDATLSGAYGPLRDNPTKYVDELVTRAYTLETIRTFCGEADFRQMVAGQLPFTRGYAILIWKYLHETLAADSGTTSLEQLMAGIPDAMKGWTEEDLRPFNSFNEQSMTLNGFFGEFFQKFYVGNPSSFALVFDEALPQDWRDEFAALLSERLGVPEGIQVLSEPGTCPFVITIHVDTPEEFSRQLGFSGLSLEDVERMSRGAGADPTLAPLMIRKDKTESNAVDISWHILSTDVPPSAVVPYYFISVTHILSIAGEPVALDSLTEETRLVTEWIKD